MVLLRSALGAMLLATSVLIAAPAAFAGEGEITFCNEFPHKVYVAIAYLQTDVNNYLSRGWLHADTGKCYVFDTAIRVPTFYYHAESDTYRDGKDKVKMKWGNDKQFAVRDAHFQSYNAEKKYSGMYFAEFSKGPESEGAPVTTTVTFLADGRSMTTLAGTKGGGNERAAPGGVPSEAAPAPTEAPSHNEDRN
jgi:uncharacterized membrane protein